MPNGHSPEGPQGRGENMKNELQERLTHEVEKLAEELTIDIPAKLGEEQKPQSYRDLTERQRAISDRVRHLRRLLGELPMVEPGVVFRDRAGFGSEVLLEDLKSKQRITYILMSGDVINLEAGEISIASPVGNALVGARVGDEVEVVTPRGVRQLRVLDIVTLFDDRMARAAAPGDDTPDLLKAMA
jgi:transcription elongation factor GreA